LVDEHDPQAGLKLLRRLKADAVLSHIAVVIYTSKYVKIDAADAKAAGANGVLRRPSTGGMAPQVLAEEALRLLGVRY
jgi:CheY-like chemotaxis protein